MTTKKILISPTDLLSKYAPQNQLESYYSALKEENRNINLVSRETIENNLPQLSAESLLPFEYVENRSFDNYIDIGSGGGFPSFPIILTQKIKQSTLVERIGKKAAALTRMADKLEIDNIQVINQNLAEIKTEKKFDLITIRLVKLDSRLFKNISRLLTKNGIIIYYFTPEIKIDGNRFHSLTYSYSISPGGPDKFFSLITKKS